MNKFNLEEQLNEVYSRYPEAEWRPVIGITGNYEELTCKLGQGYYQSVVAAGGVPLIIPPVADMETIVDTLSHIDALLLSGGGDINPLFCNEEPSPRLGGINSERDLPELLITRLAFQRQIPMLGICRGIQTLAVALGGKVEQDIYSTDGDHRVKHSQQADRSEPTHSIVIQKDSTLYNIYKEQLLPSSEDGEGGRLFVNSFHHQAVSDAGKRFKVTAQAEDGVVEAIESAEYKSVIGVQWHPECMEEGLPLFRWLASEARAYHQAHEVHNRVLTLDTHCDTPMFFPQGIQFNHRDPRILVDLHKMTEGRLDATIMAAYLPQPKMGETFSSKVEFDVQGPKQYADLIFDKIEAIAEANKDYFSVASSPGDLYENKRHGRRSVMLAIENGLALEGQLQNVEHFAKRGVVYITLCHNGDNDICDSAKGCNTHNGLSPFGKQVVREMNRLGIMVDLSHASEKSFYDALEVSSVPIVCSHSSARALCDHPRNLTDEQMRALAAHGGVAQTTIYHGFLKSDAEATILDVIAHLEHAIKVMGIDYVGLGTDFDGDGGVRGLADASELINFTRQLLARRYSERDIQKIWGGNFLRVMAQVQKERK
jgi:microsomal dipeptidase-like Zn-dependent dipeptidase/anthranilate/para-aminobenzoate synthase component II